MADCVEVSSSWPQAGRSQLKFWTQRRKSGPLLSSSKLVAEADTSAEEASAGADVEESACVETPWGAACVPSAYSWRCYDR